MHANHPEMAKRWEAETPKDAKIPERVGAARKHHHKGSRIQHIAKGLVNKAR